MRFPIIAPYQPDVYATYANDVDKSSDDEHRRQYGSNTVAYYRLGAQTEHKNPQTIHCPIQSGTKEYYVHSSGNI